MRFSIRDLLLLTVIVALATGWALDRWRLAKQNTDLKHQVRRLAEVERTRAAELAALKQALRSERELYWQLNARLLDADRMAAINDELARRGYSGRFRGVLLGPAPSPVPLEPTTQASDSDN